MLNSCGMMLWMGKKKSKDMGEQQSLSSTAPMPWIIIRAAMLLTIIITIGKGASASKILTSQEARSSNSSGLFSHYVPWMRTSPSGTSIKLKRPRRDSSVRSPMRSFRVTAKWTVWGKKTSNSFIGSANGEKSWGGTCAQKHSCRVWKIAKWRL